MAVTTKSFNSSDGGFPKGSDAEQHMKTMLGADLQQSDASKGLGTRIGKPGDMPVPPRSLYSADIGQGVIPSAANAASTGHQGAFPAGPGGEVPTQTGAGKGAKVIKTYGGVKGAPGSLTGN